MSAAEAVRSIADGSNLTLGGFAHSLTPIALVHELKIMSAAEAVRSIADGSNLTLGGFAHSLTPIALVHELIRQGKKDLDLTSMGECWAADFLAGAGRLRRVRLSNYMFEGFGRCMNFSRGVQEGRIEVEDYSHFGITSRLQAAAMGVSYLPTKVMAGSDILNVTAFDDDKFKAARQPALDDPPEVFRRLRGRVAAGSAPDGLRLPLRLRFGISHQLSGARQVAREVSRLPETLRFRRGRSLSIPRPDRP